MSAIAYVNKTFHEMTLAIIGIANSIIEEYAEQGFDLTLRQLYYQFVSRDLLANTDREYKRLGGIISDARMAGLIEWTSIVDRTRTPHEVAHWDAPSDVVMAGAVQYRVDRWATQPMRPEVWIEKDALLGVISPICADLDVLCFSCRGYVSQSSMWEASQRLMRNEEYQTTVIFHLGDHDPSGIDMTRDIGDRLRIFRSKVEVHRIALNMDQIERYRPPPNPAKVSDSRARSYIERWGSESWELDAMSPATLVSLVREAVTSIRDEDAWRKEEKRERQGRATLVAMADILKEREGALR